MPYSHSLWCLYMVVPDSSVLQDDYKACHLLFPSLALLCDCSACIHRFKGCSLKFVLYHCLLLHLTWFCRRGSKRKLHWKSSLQFLFFIPSFLPVLPPKFFPYILGKAKAASSFSLTLGCILLFWFFCYQFLRGFLILSFSPYVKRNKSKSCCSFAC